MTGYPCPQCAERMNVVDSRRSTYDGTLRRWRKCPACGYTLKTVECARDWYNRMQRLAEAAVEVLT